MRDTKSRVGGKPDETALSVRRCAESIGVSERTVLRFIASGALPAHRVGPRLWRVRPADLAAFLESGGAS